MARSIGQVYIDILARSRTFNADARRAAREAGDDAGAEFQARFNDQIKKIELDEVLSKEADRFAVDFQRATRQLGADVERGLGADFERAFQGISADAERTARNIADDWDLEFDEVARTLTAKLGTAYRKVTVEADKTLTSTERLQAALRDMGADVDVISRRWERYDRNVFRTAGVFERIRLSLRRAGTGGWFDSLTNVLAIFPGLVAGAVRAAGKFDDVIRGLASSLLQVGNRLSEGSGLLSQFGGLFASFGRVLASPVGLIVAAVAALAALTGGLAVAAQAFAGFVAGGVAIVGILTQIANVLVTASGALLSLLPLIPALIGSIGTLAVGFQGVGDAVSKMNAYLDETDPEKRAEALDEYNDALKNLSPNAQAAVRALEPLVEQFDAIAARVQDRLFEGLAGEIAGLQPFVDATADGMDRMAGAINKVILELSGLFQSQTFLDNYASTWNQISTLVQTFGTGAVQFIGGLTGLFAQLAPYTQTVADSFATAGTNFNNWVNSARGQNTIKEFMDNAFAAADKLWQIIKTVGETIGIVFGAGQDPSKDFLAGALKAAQEIKDWISERAADGRLEAWFGRINQTAAVVWDVIKQIGSAIEGLTTEKNLAFFEKLVAAFGLLFDVGFSLIGVFADIGSAIFEHLEAPLKGFATILSKVFEGLGALADFAGMDKQAQGWRDASAALAEFSGLADAESRRPPPAWPQQTQDMLTNLMTQGVLTEGQLERITAARTTPEFPAKMYEELAALVVQGQITGGQLDAVVADRPVPGYTGVFEQDLAALGLEGLLTDAQLAEVVASRQVPTFPGQYGAALGGLTGTAEGTNAALDRVVFPRRPPNFPGELTTGLRVAESQAYTTDSAIDGITTSKTTTITVTDGGSIARFNAAMYAAVQPAYKSVFVSYSARELAGIPGAAGGLFTQPTNMLIGEAGPEALIPLQRPLHMVDPSVREMAAILRGEGTSYGKGPQKIVNLTQNIYPAAADPAAVAAEVMNRAVALTRT